MTIEAIIKLVVLGVGALNNLLAKRAAAEGKSQGELLREALANVDANEAAAVKLIIKALAKKEGVSLGETPELEARLAEMRKLLA